MLRVRRHILGHRGSGRGGDGQRQTGPHWRQRRPLHRVPGHVMPDAPTGLRAPRPRRFPLLAPGRNTERRRAMTSVDQARNALGFLEDEPHERAFDTLIWGLRERRDAAAREVPEWEDLRTLASQIKEHTLSNLAHYLEMFEASAVRNCATVHWARDAHEHN